MPSEVMAKKKKKKRRVREMDERCTQLTEVHLTTECMCAVAYSLCLTFSLRVLEARRGGTCLYFQHLRSRGIEFLTSY